ncbi:hypothetical protein [Streptomyces sp. NPDC055085]
MTLRFLGTTSDGGDCPTLYEVEERGDIVVQGDKLTDSEHLAQLPEFIRSASAFRPVV